MLKHAVTEAVGPTTDKESVAMTPQKVLLYSLGEQSSGLKAALLGVSLLTRITYELSRGSCLHHSAVTLQECWSCFWAS